MVSEAGFTEDDRSLVDDLGPEISVPADDRNMKSAPSTSRHALIRVFVAASSSAFEAVDPLVILDPHLFMSRRDCGPYPEMIAERRLAMAMRRTKAMM